MNLNPSSYDDLLMNRNSWRKQFFSLLRVIAEIHLAPCQPAYWVDLVFLDIVSLREQPSWGPDFIQESILTPTLSILESCLPPHVLPGQLSRTNKTLQVVSCWRNCQIQCLTLWDCIATLDLASEGFFSRKICQIALIFFSFIFISWRLINLQYCSWFCHTLT